MKQKLTSAKLLMLAVLLGTGTVFSQNQSSGTITTTVSPAAPAPVGATEAFRFKAGIVTQLENQGTSLFGFSAADQWHSIGRINGAAQTVTGLRAQRAGRGLLFGFDGTLQSGATPTLGDPIIQWGGNSALVPSVTPGDLLFRNFTSPTSTTPVIRFRMTAAGNSYAQNGFIGHFENGTYGDITGTAGQWMSFGRVNGAAQTLYGSRIQRAGRALVTGFDGPLQTSTTTPTLGDAFIQWIGNNTSSVTPGNLDFRVAVNPTNATPTLIARMKANGRIYLGPIEKEPDLIGCFGGSPGNYILNVNGDSSGAGITTRVFNFTNSLPELAGIQSVVSSETSVSYGILGLAKSNQGDGYGVGGVSEGSGTSSTGIYGDVSCSTSPVSYGVYGTSSFLRPTNSFAGYFSGNVFTTASYLPSDKKLKNNIQSETDIMSKVMQLNPVSYYYNKSATKGLNMPDKFQHGFVAQEVEVLFPEMVTEVVAPVFGEETKQGRRKIAGTETFKSVNYTMMIPLLTKAIQEQQQTIQELQNDIAALKNNTQLSKGASTGYTLSQNVPNPFSENTTINYSLPKNTGAAVLMVTDLNGRMLLQYKLASGSSQQIIDGNKLAAGIYVYSLIVNGAEIMSKRMVLTKP